MKTSVKFIMTSALLASVIGVGCKDKQAEENAKRMEAQRMAHVRDSIETVFNQTLWDIDRNLQVIREKEGTIMMGPGSPVEKGISTKERITRSIQLINNLMDENKKKIAELEEQSKKYKLDDSRQYKLVKEAQKKIEQQEKDLTMLKDELAKKENELAQTQFDLSTLQVKMSDVEANNQMLQELSNRYETDVNTAYYAEGTYTQLKKEGVLEEPKGMFGALKKPKVNTGSVKEESYKKIDIRQVSSIPVNAKNAKLLTYHPFNSYAFKKNTDGSIASLEIKDPNSFWKMSKYLVMEVK
ncbi:MAG TPA: hypothetical protein VI112_02350 [Bacteroidia bacterium]|jgi:hypothetical protein